MMPATYKRLKSMGKAEFEAFLNSFDAVLSDCDGVLWKELDVIQGSPETVAKFKQMGKKFFYITNNCKSRAELVDKCRGFKYDATEEELLCSSYLTAVYLKELNFKKKVYIVGNQGIAEQLEAQGITHTGVGPDVIEGDERDTVLSFKPDPEVGAVVVGFDMHFSYPKLVKAGTYAHDPNILFIGTNPDVSRPSSNGNQFPDTGCFLKAIEAIAGRKAVVVGKPESFISELIKKKYGVNPARTLMIGDNPDTDILLGKRCGFTTLLVLSGITSQEELDGLPSSTTPDYCARQLSEILDCLGSQTRRIPLAST